MDCLVMPKARLMKASGLPCYVNTAPILSLEALDSMVNGSLKFGMANIDVVVMSC